MAEPEPEVIVPQRFGDDSAPGHDPGRTRNDPSPGPAPVRAPDDEPAGWAALPGPLRTCAAAGAGLLVVAAAAALIGWVLVMLAPVTLAVVAALFLTALLSPVTEFLVRRRVPRGLSALAAVLVLLLVVAGPLTLVANQALAQFDDLRDQVLAGLDQLRAFLTSGPVSQRQLDTAIEQITAALRAAAPDPVAGAMTTLQTLATIAAALVLLFFFLRDGAAMWRWVVRRLPARRRARLDTAARAAWSTLVAYVRGTMVVAAVDALGIGLALVLLGVPLAVALAFLTFLFAFVPIVGAITAGAIAVLVALVSNGVTNALLVLAAVVIVQQLEGNLLEPVIVGRAVRLHPAVVLVTVTAGALVGGVAGAVVAVPLTAVLYRGVVAGRG